MAEAESSKLPNLQAPVLPHRTTALDRTPQRERHKAHQPLSADVIERSGSAPAGRPRLTGSPWKLSPTPAVSPMILPPSAIGTTSLRTPPSKLGRPPHSDARPPTTAPVTTRVTPSQPTLGPVFVPSRQPHVKSGLSSSQRVSSSSAAWTLPPVQPIVESHPPVLGPSMSFMAIQQLQLDQGFAPTNDKRSLREIQEEEQARRVEDDFMKWWAAEEERVRLEGQIQSCAGGMQLEASKPRSPKKKISADKSNAGSDVNRPERSRTGQNTRHQTGTNKADRPRIKATS